MTRPVSLIAACVAALYGFPAAAATVVPYSGDVFVSQGDGFHKIQRPTPVKVGDAVMIGPNGMAQVQLDDGNIITVTPGVVLSVPAKAPAKDAALPAGANQTQAGGGDSTVANIVAVGGAVGVGAAAFAVADQQANKNNPVFPPVLTVGASP